MDDYFIEFLESSFLIDVEEVHASLGNVLVRRHDSTCEGIDAQRLLEKSVADTIETFYSFIVMTDERLYNYEYFQNYISRTQNTIDVVCNMIEHQGLSYNKLETLKVDYTNSNELESMAKMKRAMSKSVMSGYRYEVFSDVLKVSISLMHLIAWHNNRNR